MPDPITPQLPDPQASVDAALGSLGAPTPTTTPTTTTAPVIETPKVEVPPATVPMGDDTPLAFAAPTLNAMPTTPTSTPEPTQTPAPVMSATPVSPVAPEAPKLEPMPSVGSSYLPPVPPAPISPPPVEAKPKTKSKVLLVVIGIFAMLGVLGVGGYFAFEQFTKSQPNEVAVVSNGECGYCKNAPNQPGSCVKCSAGLINNYECSTDAQCNNYVPPSAGPIPPGNLCTPGETASCTPIAGCSGKKTCSDDGKKWSGCEKDDPSCGTTCGNGATNCGGKCVQLSTNKDNCGACGNVCSGNYNICEDSFCKSATTAQCEAAGQDPCITKYADFNLGYTCCAPGYKCDVSGTVDNGCVKVSNPPASNPPASTAPSPTPSPSTPAAPVLACTGLTQSPSTVPVIGDKVTFTCVGSITPVNTAALTYKFRYSLDGGADQILANKTNTTAELTINACGTYSVQCKVCATIAGVLKCDPTWTGAVQ